MKVSGIVFGAHDLIEKHEGDFFFLETNPAGQWGWLEIHHGLQIGAAVASELVKGRSEEHTSELQSLMRISYAVFCLKKKKININYKKQTLDLYTITIQTKQ